MPRTLADRLQSHAQQKARLAEREMLLKKAERKARTRRLIEAGGLVEKAGLLAFKAPTRSMACCSPPRDRLTTPTPSPIGRPLAAAPFPARPAPMMRPRNRS